MTETMRASGPGSNSFFKKLWRFIVRRRKLLIFLAVITAVTVFLLLGRRKPAANQMQLPQTLMLTKMDLRQIISSTGTVESGMTREVTSSLSYNISRVYVREGDTVRAGQLLAALETDKLESDIAEVRKNIAEAEAQDALSLSQAERRLQDAVSQYSIDEQRLDDEVEKAKKKAASASSDTKNAKSDMDGKKALMQIAEEAVLSYPEDGQPGHDAGEYALLLQAAADAKTTYDTAVKNYDSLKTLSDQASSSLETVTQQREMTLRQDRISIDNARDTVNSQKLKDSAANYRSQLKTYLENLEDCEILSPVSGTVTAMTAEVGKSAGGQAAGSLSPLFTIEDTNRLEITAVVPEYDAIFVKPGMNAVITSDAIDNEEWLGNVKSISPKATDMNSNFTVVVEVIGPVGRLTIGMSAKFNIVTDSKNDVFAVPYDAVTTDPMGRNVVYTIIDSKGDEGSTFPIGSSGPVIINPGEGGPAPEGPIMQRRIDQSGRPGETDIIRVPIPVTTGMETDYYIEISGEGLFEGMIILSDPEGRNVNTNSGGGLVSGGPMPMGGVRISG